MNIFILHNRYQLPGGEDGVVQAEAQLLKSYRHNVFLLEVNNDGIVSKWDKAQAAISAIYSLTSRKMLKGMIAAYSPDIIHVHNFFPLLSPSVYDACRTANVPVVQTLHNYRLACPKAMPFRDGKICENCIGKTIPWESIKHGCYRDSKVESAAVAAMLSFHNLRQTWIRQVNAYIVLTQFHKQKMIQAGLPANKLYVKPNFMFEEDYKLNSNNININFPQKEYILFVGRLSTEKGVETIIDAYIQNQLKIPLKIVGEGPLRQTLHEKVQKAGCNHVIEFLGRQEKQTVLKLMLNAKCLIFPSIWYEGFPLTLVEALSCGLPVITSGLGSMKEIVEDGKTGLQFETGNSTDLAKKIIWLSQHPESIVHMKRNALNVYKRHYTPQTNYQQLVGIYEQAISISKSTKQHTHISTEDYR